MFSEQAFGEAELKLLQDFLGDSERPEGTFTYCETAGFLFAVASAPELVMPAYWLPVIFNEEDAGFADEAEAEAVNVALMSLWSFICDANQQGAPMLPPGCYVEEYAIENLNDGMPLQEWSVGFSTGHYWLGWEETVDQEHLKKVQTMMMPLLFFSNRQAAESFIDQLDVEDFTLEAAAEDYLDALPEAMAAYPSLGREFMGDWVGQVDSELEIDQADDAEVDFWPGEGVTSTDK